MSAPTFKTGDRVARIERGRPGGHPLRHTVGVVGFLSGGDDPRSLVYVAWPDGSSDHYFYPHELRQVRPMSPEARMVWHAMRAGAKRIGRKHVTSRDGTCYRIHKYEADHIVIRVDIALPPLAEDEAGR